MSCKFKRRNCPCDKRMWTRQTVVARFSFLMGRAFPDDHEFHQIEDLFVS